MSNEKFDPVPYLFKLPLPTESNRELEKDIIICEKVEFLLMRSLNNDFDVIKWIPGFAHDKFRVAAQNYVVDKERVTYNVNAILKLDIENNLERRISDLPEFKETLYPLTRLYCIINEYKPPIGEDIDVAAAYQLAHEMGLDIEDVFTPLIMPGYSKWTGSYNKNIHPRNMPPIVNKYCFYGPKKVLLQQIVEMRIARGVARLPFSNWIKDNEPYPITVHISQSEKHYLFNLWHIKEYSHAPIFLTEHIDIAAQMCSNPFLVWSSWGWGKDAIKYVDWEPLKGRNVYYILLLENNSQNKQRVETAMAVFAKFDACSGMNLQVVLVRQEKCSFATPGVNGEGFPDRGFRYILPYDTLSAELQEKPYFNLQSQDSVVKTNQKQLPQIEVLDDISFIKLAKQYKIYIPEDIREYVDGRINTNLHQRHKPVFLIQSVIKIMTLTVIFAPSGIGKTWLGLSVGICLSNGIDIFPYWPNPSGPRKVLYILGEMNRDEIEDRVADIQRAYNIDSDNGYFEAHRINDKDISEPSGQARVEKYIRNLDKRGEGKTSVLIIDNLNTLAENASFKAGWDKLFAWIEKIKKSGITVILIHHTNKQGKYLGTSNIKNKADFMIHASETNEVADRLHQLCAGSKRSPKDKKHHEIKKILMSARQEKIVMYINHEKHRSVAGKDYKPLRIAINPDDENPQWDVKVIDYEEILSNYGYSQDDLTKIIESDHLGEELDLEHLGSESADENDDDIFPLEVPFLALPEELQREIILYLYEQGKTPHDRSSQAMAEKLEISKRSLDYIRSKTKTKVSDLK